MNFCKKCEGKGYFGKAQYCNCASGKLLSAIDKKLGSLEKIIEAPKSYQKLGIDVGAWAEHGGIVGLVLEIKGDQVHFQGQHYRHQPHKRYPWKGWVKMKHCVPAHIIGFDDTPIESIFVAMDEMARARSIDIALATKNETMFNELTNGCKSDE